MGKANNGNKTIGLMNKSINLLFIWIFVICNCLFITSCSNEDLIPNQTTSKFDDLRFIVHVDNTATGMFKRTRSGSNKKDWTVGDRIIMSIDGNDNNLCNLEYKGNGEWNVTKVNEQTNFLSDQGRLSAVHADTLGIDGNKITTAGDILYTQDGSYVKHDNVVVINLQMTQRPISRIAVVGMDQSCWIDGLEEYTQINSLTTMKWNTTVASNGTQYKEVFGDTCVFYGILPSNNDETVIHIADNNGISYERVYPKSLRIGDNIIIQGPLSMESASWNKHILVHSITLDKTELNLTSGDEFSLKADIYNKDADNVALSWSSTNNNIVTVDQKGNITALSNGDAQIVVKADDGSANTTCNIHVRNIEDFISVGYNLRSSSIGDGGATEDFTLPVTNNYSKPIHLNKQLEFSSNSGDVLIHLSEFTASFSNIDINPTETTSIYVHLFFSKNFTWTLGTNTGYQNWITIEFKRDGDNAIYKLKKYLPWDLS